jgi:hypothetical protein
MVIGVVFWRLGKRTRLEQRAVTAPPES